jgi:hypothetical protein
MKGTEKASEKSRSRIVNAQPKPKGQNARCGMEQALQEDDHVIAATKPVDYGKKLRIERRRAACQLGESVLDELTCDPSVPVRIAGRQDKILEVKEN